MKHLGFINTKITAFTNMFCCAKRWQLHARIFFRVRKYLTLEIIQLLT